MKNKIAHSALHEFCRESFTYDALAVGSESRSYGVLRRIPIVLITSEMTWIVGIDGRKSGGIGSGQRDCRAVETVFIHQPQQKDLSARIKLPATIFKKFLADGFR